MTARRRAAAWLVVMAVVVGMVWLIWPQQTPSEGEALEPAQLEEADGHTRITLTADAAARIDLETTIVAADVDGVVVPDAAVMWEADGSTVVYEQVGELTYVPVAVELDHLDDGRAWLVSGPDVGAVVVSLGAAELYGVEHGIGH